MRLRTFVGLVERSTTGRLERFLARLDAPDRTCLHDYRIVRLVVCSAVRGILAYRLLYNITDN